MSTTSAPVPLPEDTASAREGRGGSLAFGEESNAEVGLWIQPSTRQVAAR